MRRFTNKMSSSPAALACSSLAAAKQFIKGRSPQSVGDLKDWRRWFRDRYAPICLMADTDGIAELDLAQG